MQRCAFVLAGVLLAALNAGAAIGSSEIARLAAAAAVVQDIHTTIPADTWNRARCVAVMPGLKKAAFVVGGEYGKGLMSCHHNGDWTAPIFMEIGKGSWGLQIGAQSIDLVLLILDQNGVEKLLKNKVTLGAEVSVAAGPVGRDARAATDGALNAEILSYSRAQGLFAGVNLSGGALRPDDDDNQDLYGKIVSPRDVLLSGSAPNPSVAEPLLKALRRGM